MVLVRLSEKRAVSRWSLAGGQEQREEVFLYMEGLVITLRKLFHFPFDGPLEIAQRHPQHI